MKIQYKNAVQLSTRYTNFKNSLPKYICIYIMLHIYTDPRDAILEYASDTEKQGVY